MSDKVLLDKCLNFHLRKPRANNNCRNYSCQDVVDACAAKDAQIAALKSREASLCDFLNSWAREARVEEAERPEEVKALDNRLWVRFAA